MKLSYLTESMIRVPDNLVNDLTEIVYAYVISFMDVINPDDPGIGLSILETIDVHPQHPNLFKSFNFSHDKRVVLATKLGVSSYNFKYDIKDIDDLSLGFRLVDDQGWSDFAGFHESKNVIDININQLKMVLAHQKPNRRHLAYILKEIKNSIEHELMHFIQFNSFGKIDPRQIQGSKGDSNRLIDYIKYASSPLEFLPTIKTEVNTFFNKLEELNKVILINENDKAQLFRYYIGDKSARVDRFEEFLEDFRSVIFWKFKEYNKDLWKKSVKVALNEFELEK